MERKITLTEDEMPRQWYNIAPDLLSPLQPHWALTASLLGRKPSLLFSR